MSKLSISLACLVLSIAPALQAQTDLGVVDIGSATTSSVTATILHPGILASITVTTGGNPNLDFTSTGGTCTAGLPVAAADTCTITVSFAPTLAGQRFGGFLLLNQDGSIAAQGYLHGTGSGPQITYMPGTMTQVGEPLVVTGGLATDSAGGIHVANSSANFVGQTPHAESSNATDIFVDGAGNTYLPGSPNSESILLPAGGSMSESYSQYSVQQYMQAADAAGNLYQPCAAGFCKQTLQPDGTYLESTVTTDSDLSLLNVDGNGNVFATENGGMLYEFISTSGGYVPIAGHTGSITIADLSTDALGNIYGIDSNGNVYKETPQADGSATQTYLFNNALAYFTTSLEVVEAMPGHHLLAADPAGNLYFWANSGFASTANFQIPNLGNQYYPLYSLFEENYSIPSALNFAVTAQNSASAPQAITITNSGNLPLQFSTIAFPADFKEGGSAGECTEGTSLVANASCTITVQFAPVAALGGPSAQLSEQVLIATNVHNAPGTQQAITVTGTETPSTQATISFSPASLTFPSTFPGRTSAPLTLTVSNTSAVAASVSSYKFTGPSAAEFELIGKTCGYSLPAHSSCTLTYVFKPTVSGSATATMIATDSAFGAAQSVSVSGTGTLVSAISFSPTSLTFPATKAGASSATQVVTVSNPSALPMAVSTYLFSGANASEFTMPSKTCGPVLAANASCTLTIAFKPTASGAASASIVATDSASGTPQTLPLTGTGK
jgi:hypothetical protein